MTIRRVLPALGLVCYAVFLAWFMGAFATGADQSGYLNSARLLAAGQATAAMRLIPEVPPGEVPSFAYPPVGFSPNPDRLTMSPVYPAGLPLLIMAAAPVAGWDSAPGLVLGLHALAGLWLVYALGRAAGLGGGPAWFGSLLLAASPLYVILSLQTMSDLPAMVWVTAALLCAWRSRGQTGAALAAGIAFSVAVLIRPTNLLAILPMAIALGPSPRRWLQLIAGGLPGAVFFGVYNRAAYGHLAATGYGGLDTLFGWQHVFPTLLHYAVWLPVLLTPPGILALGLPILGRQQPRRFAWLAVWALVFPAFYLFYFFTRDSWLSLRFLLPAFPAIIVAALLVGRELLARLRIQPRSWWLAPAMIVVLVHGALWSHTLHVLSIGRNERAYPQMAAWMNDHLPTNAVVMARQPSGSVFYYTKFPIVRWDMMPPADFQRITNACTAAGRPVYAALQQNELGDAHWAALLKGMPGRWAQVGAMRYLSIWRYNPPPGAP
jgi:hypothetical protein